jgi:hypothetical protein
VGVGGGLEFKAEAKAGQAGDSPVEIICTSTTSCRGTCQDCRELARARERVVYHDIGIGRSDKARGASDADVWLSRSRYSCSTALCLVLVKSQ